MSGNFLRTISQNDIDSDGLYSIALNALGVSQTSVFQIYDNSGNLVLMPVRWTSERLMIDFSSVSPIEGSWSLVFSGSYYESSGMELIEATSDIQINGPAMVICKVNGIEVTLPQNPSNGDVVKVSTQGSVTARVLSGDGSYIGGAPYYNLGPSSSVELAYGDAESKWNIVSVTGTTVSDKPDKTYDDENSCIVHETNIRTREEFKDWIFRKLGWPLLSVELTDDMLDDCINDSILELSEYAYQDRKFYAFMLSNYEEGKGIEMPIGMSTIIRVSSNAVGPNAVGGGKIDNYMNDLIANGAIGFPMLGRPAGSGWVNYELAMQYLDLSQKMLGGDYDFSYDPRSRNLVLYPDPKKAGQEKGWIVVECQCMRKDDQQFGDNWVKRMALAKAKIVLGAVRGKFSDVSLPGGGRINDQDRSDGREEESALREELREKFPICNVFMM